MALDAIAVIAAMVVVLLCRFDGRVPGERWEALGGFLPVAVVLTLVCGTAAGLYGQIWRHASIMEARRLVGAGALSLLVLSLVTMVGDWGVPRSVVGLGSLAATAAQGLLRFQSRLFAYRRRSNGKRAVRVLVLGAGRAGASLIRDMLEHPASGVEPVGLLDDDPRTHGREVHGVPVLGPVWDLERHARQREAQQVVLAISEAPSELVSMVSRLCEQADLLLRIVPSHAELMGSSVTLQDVRNIRIDDLLGRQQVPTDLEAVRELLRGRRVLITGAGGSIGAEIARQVAECEPGVLLLLDHDETHLHDVTATVPVPVTQLLCDIRQGGLVHRLFAFHRPEIVFHAAAHKHVPLLENHPAEAVKTNVAGTRHVVDAAVMTGVERFVFISTDKAVRPSSVMGASKAVGEQLVLEAGREGARFSAVRFGNVLGSRGSVIPTFVRQIQQGGPVTVTDPRMTRFFMSIPEAVQLVLQAAALSEGGEVFMLEMGEPVHIMELAQRMIRLSGRRVGEDIEIRVTGMRAGEKLAEELSTPEEDPQATPHPSIVRLVPTSLPPEVLSYEVDELVQAADNGLEAAVRSSVFAVATRRARRRHAADVVLNRRVLDLAALEEMQDPWMRSNT